MSEEKLKGKYVSLAELAEGWADSHKQKLAKEELEKSLKIVEINRQLSEAFKGTADEATFKEKKCN